jgi:hypothetical protein
MENFTITDAQYILDMEDNNCSVECIFDGKFLCVPLDPANRHYAEILRQVEAGDLTIAAAD